MIMLRNLAKLNFKTRLCKALKTVYILVMPIYLAGFILIFVFEELQSIYKIA